MVVGQNKSKWGAIVARAGAILWFACALQAAPTAAGQEAPLSHWTSSWGAALMVPNPKVALPNDELTQITLRQTMRLSLGGQKLRLRISNLYGTTPLVIGAATVGRPVKPGSAELAEGLSKALRFDGAASVTIPAGMERTSDPLALPVARGDDLAVSLYAETVPAQQSAHMAAHSTQFVAKGNQAAQRVLEGARPMTSWFHLAGIEVLASDQPAVLVAIGDSITNGSGSTRDQNERWTDFLVRRLQRETGPNLGVINAGIGGNRMLRDNIGPHLLSRFERDVLSAPASPMH